MKRDKQRPRFVLCIRNDGSEELQRRKLYQVLPDTTAAKEGYLRIVDESGEDYLYPDDYFVQVRLAPAVLEEFVSSSDEPSAAAVAHDRRRTHRR